MVNTVFQIAALCLFLLLTGSLSSYLAKGLLRAWASGRFTMTRKGQSAPEVVRAHARPITFWFTMAVWHALLVALVYGFVAGVYGLWRLIVGR